MEDQIRECVARAMQAAFATMDDSAVSRLLRSFQVGADGDDSGIND